MHSVNSTPTIPQHASWSGIKSILAAMDKDGLVQLIHILYNSDPEIKEGLLMRFVPTEGCIARLRKTIVTLVYPNPPGTLPVQAGEAMKLIRKFYKISGDPLVTSVLLLCNFPRNLTHFSR